MFQDKRAQQEVIKARESVNVYEEQAATALQKWIDEDAAKVLKKLHDEQPLGYQANQETIEGFVEKMNDIDTSGLKVKDITDFIASCKKELNQIRGKVMQDQQKKKKEAKK